MNIVWHEHQIDKKYRSAQKQQQSCVLWFTGLSGSGKSTIAGAVEQKLAELNKHTYLLDGDNVRHGLCKDLAFTDEDRVENIRRVAEISKLFVDSGQIVLTAFISPFTSDRNMVRELLEQSEFIEVFIDTPIEICESRDPKGLYKKARQGEIKNFTGIDSSYDIPANPEIHIKTNELTIEQCTDQVISYLQSNHYLNN